MEFNAESAAVRPSELRLVTEHTEAGGAKAEGTEQGKTAEPMSAPTAPQPRLSLRSVVGE
jgi:hypothetical protein